MRLLFFASHFRSISLHIFSHIPPPSSRWKAKIMMNSTSPCFQSPPINTSPKDDNVNVAPTEPHGTMSTDFAQSRQDFAQSRHLQAQTHPRQMTKSQTQTQARQKHTFVVDMLYILSTVPMVILTWIQFAFNLLVMACIFYGSYKTICILAADLDKHIEKQSHIMLADIIQCSREYVKNRCALPDSPPAMEILCDKWKMCMEQDVNHIMKSRETAVILAEILNNFFGSLSDRTIYSCATLFIGSIVLTNFMLSWSRLRQKHV